MAILYRKLEHGDDASEAHLGPSWSQRVVRSDSQQNRSSGAGASADHEKQLSLFFQPQLKLLLFCLCVLLDVETRG